MAAYKGIRPARPMDPVTPTTDRLLLRPVGPPGSVFLHSGELAGMLGITMRAPGMGEIGFRAAKQHRFNGYVTEAALTACRWAFVHAATDRIEWRAGVGNRASSAVAERAGFTIEGTLRAATDSKGVRRDTWIGSLLPSDLGLPSTAPYLPARA